MRKKIGFLLLAASCSVVAAPEDGSQLPVIPVVSAAQAKADLPALPPALQKSGENALAGLANRNKSNIVVKPGVNEIIEVAVNHFNRIVTPFERPSVKTAEGVQTKTTDNVIYVGTNQEVPLTLFVTEKGDESLALSLTLIPRKVPPREVTLSLASSMAGVASTRKAEKWEKSQPYVATLESVFRTLALGDLPPGYSLDKVALGELPKCRQTGLSFNFEGGQTALGHNLLVHIGVATNTSPQAIEFVESQCGDWDIAAVSAYPKNVLEPGERTEIYVAQKRNYKKEIKVTRPSLLVGGK